MSDNLITLQPGRPRVSSRKGEYAGTTEEGERQMSRGESDGPVVPMKAGNAAGGKSCVNVVDLMTNLFTEQQTTCVGHAIDLYSG